MAQSLLSSADVSTAKAGDRRVATLDGLRAIVILSVMVFHFFGDGFMPTARPLRWLIQLLGLEQTGVDLSFVLSGFLITGILMRSRNKVRALRDFYIRRSLRTFPLYFSFLAFTFFVLPRLGLLPPIPAASQWWFWAFAQNIPLTLGPQFTSPLWSHAFIPEHFWSLAVEEHFYFVWPFLVLSLDNRRLLRLSLFLVGAAFAIRLVMASFHLETFYFTLCRMDTLLTGGIIAILSSDPGRLDAAIGCLRHPRFWIPALGTVCVAVLAGTHSVVMHTCKFGFIEAAYAVALVVALRARRSDWHARFLVNPFFQRIARYSFAMYVFHPAVFEYLQLRFPKAPLIPEFLVGAGLTYALAALSWRVVESPSSKLKEKLAPRRPTPIQPARDEKPVESSATIAFGQSTTYGTASLAGNEIVASPILRITGQ